MEVMQKMVSDLPPFFRRSLTEKIAKFRNRHPGMKSALVKALKAYLKCMHKKNGNIPTPNLELIVRQCGHCTCEGEKPRCEVL